MPTAAPAPNPTAPIRVAECRRCGQLFAVYATAGEIACPACEAATSVASLEIVELSVAAPIEAKVEAKVEAPKPAPAPIELVAPPAESAAESANVESSSVEPTPVEEPKVAEAPSRPPTVAEWLLQSEQAAPRATVERPAEGKRSLAESLGWTPGSFDVESLATPREQASPDVTDSNDSAEEAHNSAEQEEPAFAATLKDFKFDFGATPLSDPEEAVADEGVSLELSTPAEEAPQPLRLDALAAPKPAARGWGSFIGMAIGLMLVAGPAAYFAMTWDSSDPAVELASLNGEFVTDETPIESDQPAADDALASSAVAADTPAREAADPFLDSSTKPASFDKEPASFDKGHYSEPEFDLPPSAPKEVTSPAGSQVASGTHASEADPFGVKPPAAPYETAEDRSVTSATAAEPAAFAPPEEAAATPSEDNADASLANRDEMIEPATAIAEPRQFEAAPITKQTGLVNAPKYGARELAEAFSPAEAAAVGFATGSLDDPEQVSTMGQHYAHLCHLAQVLTLLDTSDPNLLTAELQAADTFKRVMRDGRSRDQSRRIAGPWIAWTGRPHGGVFFAGMPADLRRAGEVIQYEFRIGESAVPVIMAEPIDAQRFAQTGAAEVGVIGVVVENPRQWIAGYEGDAERVVWARKTLPLPRAEDP